MLNHTHGPGNNRRATNCVMRRGSVIARKSSYPYGFAHKPCQRFLGKPGTFTRFSKSLQQKSAEFCVSGAWNVYPAASLRRSCQWHADFPVCVAFGIDSSLK